MTSPLALSVLLLAALHSGQPQNYDEGTLMAVCQFDYRSAQWSCSQPMSAELALGAVVNLNKEQPFTAQSTRTPFTVFPADDLPHGAQIERQQ